MYAGIIVAPLLYIFHSSSDIHWQLRTLPRLTARGLAAAMHARQCYLRANQNAGKLDKTTPSTETTKSDRKSNSSHSAGHAQRYLW